MTITTITEGEVLTARVYKVYAGFSWANNYEMQATTTLTSPYLALQDVADRLVALERPLHIEGVVIDRVVISTYQPDDTPYNPDTFAVFPYTVLATQMASSEVLPLELCLYVRRSVLSGRFGKLYYRGCLQENGLSSGAFRPALTDTQRNNFQTVINNWLTAGRLGTEFNLVMARGRPVPTDVRQVTTLNVEKRVVVKQIRNRYFDIP